MKRILLAILLCLCLCACGQQTPIARGDTLHVYGDSGYGTGPIYLYGALADIAVPDHAILHVAPYGPAAAVDWAQAGLTVEQDTVTGSKSQWNAIYSLQTPEVQQGLRLHTVPFSPDADYPETVSPGVLYYAAHPEQFVLVPTLAYWKLGIYQYHMHAQNIPALLEREEEVSQIRFVGHYMVKE